MSEVIYRQSKTRFIFILLADFILFFFFVGLILLPIHIIEYLKNFILIREKGVVLKKGWLSLDETEVPFSKINSVTIKRGILGRLFNYGDVRILVGNDISGIPFRGVENPEELKTEIISNLK